VRSFYDNPLKFSLISSSWVGVNLYAPIGTNAHRCSIVFTTNDSLSNSENDFSGSYAGISKESSKLYSSNSTKFKKKRIKIFYFLRFK
jgi:hypothetical protein